MLTYTMRLGICDNDPADLDRLTRMVQEIAAQADIACEMTLYESAAALLLDVMMDEMTGMELAARLRQQKSQTAIVFISSNREMALCGYEVSALRFLAKPVAADKLHEALLLCYESGMDSQRLLLPTANGMRQLSVYEVSALL